MSFGNKHSVFYRVKNEQVLKYGEFEKVLFENPFFIKNGIGPLNRAYRTKSILHNFLKGRKRNKKLPQHELQVSKIEVIIDITIPKKLIKKLGY